MNWSGQAPLDILVDGGDETYARALAHLGHTLHREQPTAKVALLIAFLDANAAAWERFTAFDGPKVAVLEASPEVPNRAEHLRGAQVVCTSETVREAWALGAHVIYPGLDPLEYPPCASPSGILTIFDPGSGNPAPGYAEVMDMLDWQADALGGAQPNSLPEDAWDGSRARALSGYGVYFHPGGPRPVPRALAEAMLCGLAPVVSDTPEMRRLITNGVDGFLERTPKDLAALLTELSQNTPLRAHIAGNARTTALRRFHINHFFNAWEAVITDALTGRPPAAVPEINTLEPRCPPVVYVSAEHPESGTTAYRVHNACAALRAWGVETKAYTVTELAGGIPEDLFSPRCAALVCHRLQAGPVLDTLLAAAERAGVLPVYETDDLLFEPDFAARLAALQGLTQTAAEAEVAGYRAAVTRFTHATCTNDLLAEALHGAGVAQAAVVPNVLGEDVRAVSRAVVHAGAPKALDTVVLGYASGSATHERDLARILPSLVRALDTHPGARLHLLGEIALPEALYRFGARVRRVPFVSRLRLPALVARFDVNLAPLEDSPFCRAKSALKYFEAAAVGVPTVATPAPAFSDAITHGETGLLAANTEAWDGCLDALIKDAGLRRRLGENAREDLATRYTPEAMAKALCTAFLHWRA